MEAGMETTTVAFLTGGFVGVFVGVLIMGCLIIFMDKR
jgi:predicted PurR-regulated permease PerM